jgi:hypothetical protein
MSRKLRNAWFVSAIETTIGPDERVALEQAIHLLERVASAESKLGPGHFSDWPDLPTSTRA